jgi:hypothetical protein
MPAVEWVEFEPAPQPEPQPAPQLPGSEPSQCEPNESSQTLQTLAEAARDAASSADDGTTALHWAAKNGHADLVRLLVEEGAELSATQRDGSTPFSLACRCASWLPGRRTGGGTQVPPRLAETPPCWWLSPTYIPSFAFTSARVLLSFPLQIRSPVLLQGFGHSRSRHGEVDQPRRLAVLDRVPGRL